MYKGMDPEEASQNGHKVWIKFAALENTVIKQSCQEMYKRTWMEKCAEQWKEKCAAQNAVYRARQRRVLAEP